MDAEYGDRLIERARATAAEREVAAILNGHLDLTPAEREAGLERLAETGTPAETQAAVLLQNEPQPADALARVALAAVVSASETPDCAILRVVVRHTTPAVRPDDVLTALRAVTELAPPTPPLVTRLAQGPLHSATAGVADPLAADQNDAGA